MIPADLAERVRPFAPDTIVARGEVTSVVERGALREILARLRDDPDLAFDLFVGVTASDWPGSAPRYWLAYDLASVEHLHRIRVKVGLAQDDAVVPSVVDLFPTADWHEREAWDFFGIVFEGHPRLERLLLPEGWEGHPLRKTEELGGVNTRYHGGAFIPPVDRRVAP